MAIRKSIRPARQSDRPGTNRPRNPAPSGAPNGEGSGPSLRIVPAEQASDAVRRLVMVALRLKVIYGTALSVELALRKQDAEQDVDIAECLRSGVCNPIAEQADNMRSLAEKFGAQLPEALP
jgi:hypothetical protein